MYKHRAVVAALHIVFASPDEFHRGTPKSLRDNRRFTLHVRVSDGTPTKPAAGHFRVERNLFRLQSQGFCYS